MRHRPTRSAACGRVTLGHDAGPVTHRIPTGAASLGLGTILVVRIGTTTFDSVTRALQSLCENNVLGVVVNGARRGGLYSKYTYYHDYYYSPDAETPDLAGESEEAAVPQER